jgi:hypothetical protein
VTVTAAPAPHPGAGFPGQRVLARALTRRLTALPLAAVVLLVAASVPAMANAPNSLRLKATYDVSATLNWAAGTLAVSSTAKVTNGTDEPVEALTFNLLPAKIGQMVLQQTLVGAVPAATAISEHSLIVTLPEALRPGREVPVQIDYSAKFKTNSKDKNWLFAKINGVATAYRWIPWLSRAMAYDRPNFGEPFVTATSDEVRVRLTSDRKLVYATSGKRSSVSGLTQTFIARNVRDFNFSVSPTYKVVTSTQGTTKVKVFYRTLNSTTLMSAAKKALKGFKSRIGPYPWTRFMVAESHSGLGMESPGLIWIPATTAASNLVYLTTHETAHQWFYAAVGSDQADQPFADEALAEYLTRDLMGSSRASKCSTKTLDRTIYEYGSSCYYEVVYIQGFNYIKAYRSRVGDTAFWQGMRAYYDAYRFRIGGTREFLETLDSMAPPSLAGGHQQRFPRLYPV